MIKKKSRSEEEEGDERKKGQMTEATEGHYTRLILVSVVVGFFL